MKRAVLLAITTALLLALTAGIAWAVTYNEVNCSANPCNGTNSADRIVGSDGRDVIGGRAGNDRILTQKGNDVAKGGTGNDFMYGEAGADTLQGALGDDFLSGAGGPDTIYGGADDDRVYSHGGNDTVRLAGDASNRDYVNCGSGDSDTVYLDTNDVVDSVRADTLAVNSGLSCERIYTNGILVPTAP